MTERLLPGRDRAAVVVYGDGEFVQVLAPLADCCGAARLALELLPRYDGSRMDLAIDAAVAQLTGPSARDDAKNVLVLFTDGDLNQTPEARLLASAAGAQRVGIRLHAVGIGAQADPALLARVTGGPGRVFLTRTMRFADVLSFLAPLPRCHR